MRLACPHLHGEVVLTPERERHIQERHPDLLPKYRARIAETLADPDQVRRGAHLGNARLFSRWFDDIIGGKHVVVVVISEVATGRHWMITAYLVRKLGPGDVEWKRN
jgi:hypothetical protein